MSAGLMKIRLDSVQMFILLHKSIPGLFIPIDGRERQCMAGFVYLSLLFM